MDKDSVRNRLGPQQLAIGVSAGAEAMVHATREWVVANAHDVNSVLLKRDIINAFNEVHPHEFLDDCYSYAPCSSKFAEHCYGAPSHLIYHDRLLASCRGQQGCPLMAPCSV